MKAIAIERGEQRLGVLDVPEPTPEEGEVLVRTLRVGIDGTDHEVINGAHGHYPEGADYQILGHEAVGVVEDANGTSLSEGQIVVPTVRRPPPESDNNEYFERDEPDMAPDGTYVERGIVGAHGFMSEYFTSPTEFLVPVPDSFREHGFLIEPISNSEKAVEIAFAARSSFDWQPESAFVLGNGPLGLLTLAMFEQQREPYATFERTYCLGRRDRPDHTIDIIERLGGTYVDSRKTPVDEIGDIHEMVDMVHEATGYGKHPFEAIDTLAPNGVGVLLGIPNNWSFDIDGGRLHRDIVLHNKALLGSVNSHVPHFERAMESLATFPDWSLDALVTGVYSPDKAKEAFNEGNGAIKTTIEFSEP